jgi:hypothetical protein
MRVKYYASKCGVLIQLSSGTETINWQEWNFSTHSPQTSALEIACFANIFRKEIATQHEPPQSL